MSFSRIIAFLSNFYLGSRCFAAFFIRLIGRLKAWILFDRSFDAMKGGTRQVPPFYPKKLGCADGCRHSGMTRASASSNFFLLYQIQKWRMPALDTASLRSSLKTAIMPRSAAALMFAAVNLYGLSSSNSCKSLMKMGSCSE